MRESPLNQAIEEPGIVRNDSHCEPDNQTGYVNPRAWRNVKKAFGVREGNPLSGGIEGRAACALEAYCRQHSVNIRLALASAIRMYLAISTEARMVAYEQMWEDERNNHKVGSPENQILDNYKF